MTDTCLVGSHPTRSTWLFVIGQRSIHSSGGGLAHPHTSVEMVGCPPLHARFAIEVSAPALDTPLWTQLPDLFPVSLHLASNLSAGWSGGKNGKEHQCFSQWGRWDLRLAPHGRTLSLRGKRTTPAIVWAQRGRRLWSCGWRPYSLLALRRPRRRHSCAECTPLRPVTAPSFSCRLSCLFPPLLFSTPISLCSSTCPPPSCSPLAPTGLFPFPSPAPRRDGRRYAPVPGRRRPCDAVLAAAPIGDAGRCPQRLAGYCVYERAAERG